MSIRIATSNSRSATRSWVTTTSGKGRSTGVISRRNRATYKTYRSRFLNGRARGTDGSASTTDSSRGSS